jgi:hypothetical protein
MGSGLTKGTHDEQRGPFMVQGCAPVNCAVNETAMNLQRSADFAAEMAEARERAREVACEKRRAEHAETTRRIAQYIAESKKQPFVFSGALAMPTWHALFEVKA